jgi:adenylylsulfate kinase-like enzyme
VKLKQKLIIISGAPCTGKTAVAENLFESYENSAHFDGDWAWRVNPFSLSDPRLGDGEKTMSFALSTYLNSKFDYVIFSAVVAMFESSRKNILENITEKDFITLGFTLTCSEKTLTERHRQRGDEGEANFHLLRLAHYPGDYVINTDDKTIMQIVDEMKSIIDIHGA